MVYVCSARARAQRMLGDHVALISKLCSGDEALCNDALAKAQERAKDLIIHIADAERDGVGLEMKRQGEEESKVRGSMDVYSAELARFKDFIKASNDEITLALAELQNEHDRDTDRLRNALVRRTRERLEISDGEECPESEALLELCESEGVHREVAAAYVVFDVGLKEAKRKDLYTQLLSESSGKSHRVPPERWVVPFAVHRVVLPCPTPYPLHARARARACAHTHAHTLSRLSLSLCWCSLVAAGAISHRR